MTPRSWTSAPSALFDKLYSEPNRRRLDRLVVNVSIAGLIAHLGVIFLSRHFLMPNLAWAAFVASVGKNYLSAIYTPFSFVLFYEVLMLIGALPQSTTQSIAKQYEIVSLIFMRGFFKDIAELHGTSEIASLSPEVWPALTNVTAGLLMFLLVTVFVHAAQRRPQDERPESEMAELEKFIARKKLIALGLTILLLLVALKRVIEFALGTEGVNLNSFFYTDVFTVMIFTDVLIVILSLAVSDRYEMVFRNGAFVISTILIRLSLTAETPYGAALALLGMVFGIGTLLVYNYHMAITGPAWIHHAKPAQRREKIRLS